MPSLRLAEAAGEFTDVTGADQLAHGRVTDVPGLLHACRQRVRGQQRCVSRRRGPPGWHDHCRGSSRLGRMPSPALAGRRGRRRVPASRSPQVTPHVETRVPLAAHAAGNHHREPVRRRPGPTAARRTWNARSRPAGPRLPRGLQRSAGLLAGEGGHPPSPGARWRPRIGAGKAAMIPLPPGDRMGSRQRAAPCLRRCGAVSGVTAPAAGSGGRARSGWMSSPPSVPRGLGA